jgi:hypothetical protein
MDTSSGLSLQLSRVEEKLAHLRRLDRRFATFGSSSHKYKLKATIPEKQILDFEEKNGIVLPFDYRCFIRFVGNGGAGPFYGLEKVEDGIFGDLDRPNKEYTLNLSAPFPYSEEWNLESGNFDNYLDFEDEYFDSRHANGLLRLCNFGCGVFINLVVNGFEYGHMWTDDRVSDHGIYPSTEFGNECAISFINWYELWLDHSLGKL